MNAIDKSVSTAWTAGDYGKGTYYALDYTSAKNGSKRSDYTLTGIAQVDGASAVTVGTNDVKYTIDKTTGALKYVEPQANLSLYTAQNKVLENSDLNWGYKVGDTVANFGTAPISSYSGITSFYKDGDKWYYDNAGTKTEVSGDDNIKILEASATTSATLYVYYGGKDGIYGWDLKTSATDGYTKESESSSNYWKDCSEDDITIEIGLVNIGVNSEQWTALTTTNSASGTIYTTNSTSTGTIAKSSLNNLWTFYYNNDLEEGDTTSKLVDYVKLGDNVTQRAFMAFDFDLNVFMDSVQVSLTEEGAESFASIQNEYTNTFDSSKTYVGWGISGANAQTTAPALRITDGSATQTAGTENSPEITSITWNKAAEKSSS